MENKNQKQQGCSRRGFLGKMGKGALIAGVIATGISVPKKSRANSPYYSVVPGACSLNQPCNICAASCQNNAVEFTTVRNKTFAVLNDECTGCGSCFEECPVGAIVEL